MASLENVARIRTPSPEELWREHALLQTPVILTDLFDGQPVRALDTEKRARARLGPMPVRAQEEHSASVLRAIQELVGDPPDPEARGRISEEPRDTTVAGYLDHVAANPRSRLLVSDQLWGDDPLSALYARPRHVERGTSARTAFLFLGNAGNVTNLHFDYDHNHVLMYQVFGTKRFILFSPTQSAKLAPIEIWSTILLRNFSEADKLAFIRYAGGWDCVLNPGETLLMPALIWHHIEYLDHALSFNIRFGRSRYGSFLANNTHRDMYAQNIGAKLLDEAVVEAKYLDVFREIESACGVDYPDPRSKYLTIRALLREIYARICDDAVQSTYAFNNFGVLERSLSFFWKRYEDSGAR